MNAKSKGESRLLWTVVKEAAVKFLLVSAGAAFAGALYMGLCGAIVGLVEGGWWAAALGGGERGALAGLAAGVLTMTFGGASAGRVMSVCQILVPTSRRGTRGVKRRPTWQSASRPMQNASPPISAPRQPNDSNNNHFTT